MKPPLFLCVMLLSSSVAAQNDHQRQKDSLWNAAVHSEGVEKLDTYARLTNYYFAEKGDQKKRDTLFSLYDLIDRESEKLGGHEERRVKVRANRLIVLTGYDAQLYDQAIALAPDYLSFAAERNAWDIYYQIYRAYISAYWNQKDNDTALALAKEMYEDAKERGSNAGMGIAFYMMSRIYSTQQRSEEEEECLREAIELTKGKESVINILVDAYTLLGGCLIEQKRYEEAKRFTGEWEEAIAVYEGIINQPSIVARANQLLIYTQACIGLKQFDEAERCCSKIDSLTNGVQVLYVERAAIFAERREYDKALEMIDKAIEAISPAYKIDPMGKKLVILIQKGDSEGAKQLFDEVIEFLKSTHSEQLNAQLDEIRTLHQVDKINAQKERLRTILIFSFGLCIFLTIALGIWIYYSRVVVKKNRGLYRQIKEQEMMANELEAMAKQYEALAQGHPHEPRPQLLGTRQQRQLVSRLRDYLMMNKHFVKSELDNQELIAELATNRTYLFQALKAVTGRTPQEFITALRLEEAKRMLASDFNFSMDEVYESCGFASRTSFFRIFKEQFAITPAQYRKMAREEV